MPGFLHSPQNDIDSLRDLLKGYGNAQSILKELIQNSEDARASRFHLIYFPGDTAGSTHHPLLKGPALCAVNDGPFDHRDRDAIFKIGSGTKAADDSRIGRFGKGLKGVFSLCEAFFLVSSKPVCQESLWFMNPYAGWRHEEWEVCFAQNHNKISGYLRAELEKNDWSSGNWLAFWLPLRTDGHLSDREGRVAPIHHWGGDKAKQPGADFDLPKSFSFTLKSLGPSLTLLRHLEVVRFTSAAAPALSTEFMFSDTQRCLCPTKKVLEREVRGCLKGPKEVRFWGLTGRLDDPEFDRLHQGDDWPQVMDTGSGESVPVKGQPHWGCVFATESGQAPSLRIQWAVHLPVAIQPDETPLSLDPEHWSEGIVATLHGCFFLDSTRMRIDGLGQPSPRAAVNAAGPNRTSLLWNHRLAEQGTLAHLPKALELFVRENQTPAPAIRSLVASIRETRLWRDHGQRICTKFRWIFRAVDGKEEWAIEASRRPILHMPLREADWEGSVSDFWNLFPALSEIAEYSTIVHETGESAGLFEQSSLSVLSAEQLTQLLSTVRLTEENRPHFLKWLSHQGNLVGSEQRDILRRLPLCQILGVSSNEFRWVDFEECVGLRDSKSLFHDHSRLDDLGAALPEQELWRFNGSLDVSRILELEIPVLSAHAASEVVLRQQILSPISARIPLVRWILQSATPSNQPIVRQAVRYLLHGVAVERNNTTAQLLYALPGNQGIWPRLMKQALSLSDVPTVWRMVSSDLAREFSDQQKADVNLRPIQEEACLRELEAHFSKLDNLEFSSTIWTNEDIEGLLSGLLNSDRSRAVPILRRLRIHQLEGQPRGTRISIGDESGKLQHGIFLNAPGFSAKIAEAIREEWRAFLEEVTVVERLSEGTLAAAAQESVFRSSDEEGVSTLRELSWRGVVGQILDFSSPERFSGLVLQALKEEGGAAMAGLAASLREKALFKDQSGRLFRLNQVIHIDGLEEDLRELFLNVPEVLTMSDLPDDLRNHPGFWRNRTGLLPGFNAVLDKVSERLGVETKWALGISRDLIPEDWVAFLDALRGCSAIPVVKFILRLNGAKGSASDENFRDAILPAIGRAWPSSEIDRRVDTFNFLRQLPCREPHDIYLAQLVGDQLQEQVLPRIHLLNAEGHWRPVADLIWPTEGPPPRHQLHRDHEKILTGEAHTSSVDDKQGEIPLSLPRLDRNALPDLDDTAAELIRYLDGFRDAEDFPLLAASFVAVCFDHPELRHYAENLLRPLGKAFDDLREQLFQGRGSGATYDFAERRVWEAGIFIFRFVSPTEAREYETVLGGLKQIPLEERVTNLLADSRRLLKPLGQHDGRTVREVILRRAQAADIRQDLPGIWRRTLQLIVRHGYGLPDVFCPDFTSLEKMLGREYSLRRIQRTLLDTAEFRLKELRCHGDPAFLPIMETFDEARQARLDAEDFQAQEMFEQAAAKEESGKAKRREAEAQLASLLTASPPDPAEKILIEAMCRKLSEYGYSDDSVLLELFQNADDALAELSNPEVADFILEWKKEERVLRLFHWGRPVNDPLHHLVDSPACRRYSRDLEKMLTLNFSEKVEEPGRVTGRFGLGFKSVFFFSDRPCIRSRELRCMIRGAFYPERPAGGVVEHLEAVSAGHLSSEMLTVIEMGDLKITDERIEGLLERFHDLSRYLIHTARAVRCIRIHSSAGEVRANRSSCEGKLWQLTDPTQGQRLWIVSGSKGGSASWIFELGSRGFSPRPASIPAIWATAPTREVSAVGCAVNGDWIPDAGRLRIAHQVPENRQVAEKTANRLAEALLNLIETASADWPALVKRFHLDPTLDLYHFWASLWKVLQVSDPVERWEDVSANGEDLINGLLWNRSFGAMRRLVEKHALIPSGLDGQYRVLLTQPEVKYCLDGCLLDFGKLREACLQWSEFKAVYPCGTVVSGATGAFIRSLHEGEDAGPAPLRLIDVVRLFVSENGHVSTSAASRLGGLLNREMWSRLEMENYGRELKELRAFLNELKFANNSHSFVSVNDLLVGHQVRGVEEIELDERRRARMAPASRVLSTDFDRDALRFFALCRMELNADSTLLAEWAEAADGERLAAVFDYFFDGQSRGELAQGLADKLGIDWLARHESTDAFQGLPHKTKQEIWLLFRKVEYSTAPVSEQLPLFTGLTPEEAFVRVQDWWEAEREERLPAYLDDSYGTLQPSILPWPSDDAWGFPGDRENLVARKEWMALFVHAALRTQGWYVIGRNRYFVEFLENNQWLDILANPESDPADYISILDQFLGDKPEAIVYYHSMRQFITFYASSQHLETLVEGIRNIEARTAPFPLRHAFSLGLNPDFSGTGLVMPSFERGFGPGANLVVRELYRLGRLRKEHGFRHAYVLPRRVRELCGALFQIPGFAEKTWRDDTSANLYDRLLEVSDGLDVTFHRCFDIPLEILASDPDLQEEVFGLPIVDGSDDPEDPDFEFSDPLEPCNL